VAGECSEWVSVDSGVPQGSVLGPLLFVCYINGLPDCVKSSIYMYADDTKIIRRVDSVNDRETLQEDLERLDDWSDRWQLKFNANKCMVMHIGRQGVIGKQEYNMRRYGTNEREVLKESEVEKDLGIWVDNKLKFSVHAVKVVNKANQILGMIRRSFTHLDAQTMKLLFCALVRPHLEYGNVVWHPSLRKDTELLESVQHRATRMVPGFSKLSYEERLRKLRLPSLEYRRKRGDMIEVYKYLHGIYSVDCTTLLPLEDRKEGMVTRGHELKLQKRSVNGRLRLNGFGLRTVNRWNLLPQDIVMADTINSFKGRFDAHCKSMMYSLNVSDDTE